MNKWLHQAFWMPGMMLSARFIAATKTPSCSQEIHILVYTSQWTSHYVSMQPKCDEDLLHAMPDVFLLSNNSLHYSSCPPGGIAGQYLKTSVVVTTGVILTSSGWGSGMLFTSQSAHDGPPRTMWPPCQQSHRGETLHYSNCPSGCWIISSLAHRPFLFPHSPLWGRFFRGLFDLACL